MPLPRKSSGSVLSCTGYGACPLSCTVPAHFRTEVNFPLEVTHIMHLREWKPRETKECANMLMMALLFLLEKKCQNSNAMINKDVSQKSAVVYEVFRFCFLSVLMQLTSGLQPAGGTWAEVSLPISGTGWCLTLFFNTLLSFGIDKKKKENQTLELASHGYSYKA